MGIAEAFALGVDLADALGHRQINRLPGCCEIQVDEHWWIAFNGHSQNRKATNGANVPPFTMAVQFNGWPAGLVDAAGGVIAAGAAANEETLVAALRAAIARAKAQPLPKPSRVAQGGHHCHARGCAIEVPPKMLMCKRHWFMVPKALRDAVWSTYRPGQEVDKSPSVAWAEAADAAIAAVARQERPRG